MKNNKSIVMLVVIVMILVVYGFTACSGEEVVAEEVDIVLSKEDTLELPNGTVLYRLLYKGETINNIINDHPMYVDESYVIYPYDILDNGEYSIHINSAILTVEDIEVMLSYPETFTRIIDFMEIEFERSMKEAIFGDYSTDSDSGDYEEDESYMEEGYFEYDDSDVPDEIIVENMSDTELENYIRNEINKRGFPVPSIEMYIEDEFAYGLVSESNFYLTIGGDVNSYYINLTIEDEVMNVLFDGNPSQFNSYLWHTGTSSWGDVDFFIYRTIDENRDDCYIIIQVGEIDLYPYEDLTGVYHADGYYYNPETS